MLLFILSKETIVVVGVHVYVYIVYIIMNKDINKFQQANGMAFIKQFTEPTFYFFLLSISYFIMLKRVLIKTFTYFVEQKKITNENN